MLKKLIIVCLLFLLPMSVRASMLSDEPIASPEEFEQQQSQLEDEENPEFEYSTSNTPEVVEVEPTKDYASIYQKLEVPNFSYLHNIDPDQYYDMKDATWAPYPLLRLNSPIYFKSITVEPGYYLLTAREHKGKWYLLLKQNGQVMHIIPTYERDIVPELFYDKHLPKPKLTKAQKIHMGALDFLGKFKSTKRKEPIKSYMEINDLPNNFVSIIIYYGSHKYSTLFRSVKF